MPELPEVETIKRIIEPQIQGLRIERVSLRRPEIIAHPGADTFCSRTAGQTISGMDRRGKYLLILLEGGSRLIIHLRMTGCLLPAPGDFPEETHTHLVFLLSNGTELRFSDTRRFGRIWLFQNHEPDTCSGIEKLGMDPFDPHLSAEYLQARWGNRKRAIKDCLLEQNVIAGIGNIYSDEILFTSHIHPARPANSLSEAEWNRLACAIPERLGYFIEKNQIRPEEYLETGGRDYRNTPFLQVYGHGGDPCPICKTPLCRRVIGGRSSIFCPDCQKESPVYGRTSSSRRSL